MVSEAQKPQWAANVEAVLEKQGRTRSWLAKRIGMDYGQLWRLMNSQPVHGTPYYYHLNERTVKAISDALEVPESLIFGECEKDES